MIYISLSIIITSRTKNLKSQIKRVLGLPLIIRPLCIYGVCLLVLVLIPSLSFPLSYELHLYAQQMDNITDNTTSRINIMKNATDDGILDVLLEPIPYPAKVNLDSMKFKLSFLKPNATQLQNHVDFNLRIFKDDKQVFQATNQTGQPLVPLHATDGFMTIPMLNYQFDRLGKYVIEVPVYGSFQEG